MNKPFKEILVDYLADTMKKFIPIFWVPVLGDVLIEKIKKSRAVNFMCNGWVMISLM